MKTVGEILSEKRKQLDLEFGQIEKETKIRQKYLEAIEKNDFNFLPESTTVKGFIKNYASFLNLSSENVLAIFRRDFEENEKGQINPKGFTKEIEEKKISWTPKITFFLSIVILLSVFALFFIKQYSRFSSAPALEISSPVEGGVYGETIEVKGKTDRDATLKINDSLVSVLENGNFQEKIVLPRGENILTIESANRQGKKKTENIKIKVE